MSSSSSPFSILLEKEKENLISSIFQGLLNNGANKNNAKVLFSIQQVKSKKILEQDNNNNSDNSFASTTVENSQNVTVPAIFEDDVNDNQNEENDDEIIIEIFNNDKTFQVIQLGDENNSASLTNGAFHFHTAKNVPFQHWDSSCVYPLRMKNPNNNEYFFHNNENANHRHLVRRQFNLEQAENQDHQQEISFLLRDIEERNKMDSIFCKEQQQEERKNDQENLEENEINNKKHKTASKNIMRHKGSKINFLLHKIKIFKRKERREGNKNNIESDTIDHHDDVPFLQTNSAPAITSAPIAKSIKIKPDVVVVDKNDNNNNNNNTRRRARDQQPQLTNLQNNKKNVALSKLINVNRDDETDDIPFSNLHSDKMPLVSTASMTAAATSVTNSKGIIIPSSNLVVSAPSQQKSSSNPVAASIKFSGSFVQEAFYQSLFLFISKNNTNSQQQIRQFLIKRNSVVSSSSQGNDDPFQLLKDSLFSTAAAVASAGTSASPFRTFCLKNFEPVVESKIFTALAKQLEQEKILSNMSSSWKPNNCNNNNQDDGDVVPQDADNNSNNIFHFLDKPEKYHFQKSFVQTAKAHLAQLGNFYDPLLSHVNGTVFHHQGSNFSFITYNNNNNNYNQQSNLLLRNQLLESRRSKELKLASSFENAWKVREQFLAQRRLAALKANNPEEYVKHLRTAKWSSLLEIMDKTHNLMLKIGAQLEKKNNNDTHVNATNNNDNDGVDAAIVTCDKNQQQQQQQQVSTTNDAYVRFQSYVRSASDEYKLIHKNPIFVQDQPECVQASLMPHQLVGLRFLASLHGNNINGILADEQGVGKTLQTLSLLAYLKESGQRKGMHLVIAPLSIIREWQEAVSTFVPSLKVAHITTDADFSEIRPSETDLCLLALNRVRFFSQTSSSCLLYKHKWHYVVVDEAHKAVSNPETATARAIHQIPFHNRLVLTGTPLNSDVQELWSLLQFINPDIFSSGDGTQATFDEVFRRPFANLGLKNSGAELRLEPEERDIIIMRLHQILKPFVLRRTKLDIDTSLRITFHTIWCPLSALQAKLLSLLRSPEKKRSLPAILRDGSCQYQRGNSVTSSALSICNHPFMCDFLPQLMRRDKVPENEEDEISLKSSGKLCVLDALLVHLRSQNRKAVIFSHFLETIDIVENHFVARGWGEMFVSLTGNSSTELRAAAVRQFRDDPDTFIFLLSMKAGGCGLNLQTADTIILYDRDYTATNEEQAIARVFRMGQKNVVRAIYLMTKDDVEKRVAAIAVNKDKPRKEIIEGGSYQVKTKDDDDEEEDDDENEQNIDNSNNNREKSPSSSQISKNVNGEERDDDNEGQECGDDNGDNDGNDQLLPDEDEIEGEEEKTKSSNKEKQKSSCANSVIVEDIRCDDILMMEEVLKTKVFNGFLSRTVPRDEINDKNLPSQQDQIPEKNDEENIDDIPLREERTEEEGVELKNEENNDFQDNNPLACSVMTNDNLNNEHNDSSSQNSAKQKEELSHLSPLLLPSLIKIFSIILPYHSDEEFHPSIQNAFLECEKNEIEGADGEMGIGCRKNKIVVHDDLFDSSSSSSDDDDDENKVKNKKNSKKTKNNVDPEFLHLFLVDQEPDFDVLEKIMDEEDLSDEDEALEVWRNRIIAKNKSMKSAEDDAKKLADEWGDPIVNFDFPKFIQHLTANNNRYDNVDNSFSFQKYKKLYFSILPSPHSSSTDLAETNGFSNNFSSEQRKEIKENFKPKQIVLKFKTQYPSDFASNLVESFSTLQSIHCSSQQEIFNAKKVSQD